MSWWLDDDTLLNCYPRKQYYWQQVHYDFKDCLWLSMDSNWISRLDTRSLQFCLKLLGILSWFLLVTQFSKYTLRFVYNISSVAFWFVYNISSVKLASNPSCTVCIENKETCTFTMVMIIHQISGFGILSLYKILAPCLLIGMLCRSSFSARTFKYTVVIFMY